MRWLLLLLPLCLIGCGGGGGSSTPPAPPPPRVIDFTFFGQSDTAVTAPFTSVYHAIDWGDWSKDREAIKLRIIDELQQARARGVDRFILSVGFLTFDTKCAFLGADALAAFKLQLQALDLARSVFMLYPLDEPDGMNCDDKALTAAYKTIQTAWGDVRIGVIYGDTGRMPGITAVTDAGRDHYRFGPQVISLRSDQRLMLVAGGADPYREDIQQYVDYAKANPSVSLVWAFLFIPYTDPDGHPQLGIGGNGMLPAYRAAGCQLTMKC